jgi:hypothetical protein
MKSVQGFSSNWSCGQTNVLIKRKQKENYCGASMLQSWNQESSRIAWCGMNKWELSFYGHNDTWILTPFVCILAKPSCSNAPLFLFHCTFKDSWFPLLPEANLISKRWELVRSYAIWKGTLIKIFGNTVAYGAFLFVCYLTWWS